MKTLSSLPFQPASKPGEFRARCRATRWAPLREVLDGATETTRSRWDNRLKENVFETHCVFDTDDRDAYLTHMRDVHGGALAKLYRGEWHRDPHHPLLECAVDTKKHLAALPLKPWRAPKLLDEGRPWEHKKYGTVSCDGCGLVAEVGDSEADELWWREHLDRCVYRTHAEQAS